jgi:hypothetical protein
MAMADKHGRVWGSIPGIANRARVSVSVCEAALNKFLAPDPYSRSNTYDPETEGRRIEVIEGGWRLINHAHYRAIRDEEERRAYKAEHERNRRAVKRGQRGQKWTGVESDGHNAEAEAEAEAGKSRSLSSAKTKGTRIPESFIVTDEHKAWAMKKAMPDPDSFIEGFCDYWKGRPGAGGLKLDWDATFRNWIRNEVSRTSKKGMRNGKPNVLDAIRDSRRMPEFG